MKMSASYEIEQKSLESRTKELKEIIATSKENSLNTQHFISLVQKYTDVRELSAELIREFVEKIYVYKAEKIDGRRTQKIKIVWNCIGEFNTPTK